MNIEEKQDYLLITSNENSFEEFRQAFEKKHAELVGNNLIIQLSNKLNPTNKNIFIFLKHAELHQNNGTTFVVISQNVDVDEFPETFNIVPTLQEAEDILEMENIQRDLGF